MKKIIGMTASGSLIVFGAFLFFGINGNAYIDPSVTTYLIQAVAGIVIAVGAALGIYFRKAKKKLNEKLGIDDNRNKEVESDEIIVNSDADDVNAADE